MKPWIKIGAAIVSLQIAGIATYVVTEQRRDAGATTLGAGAPERIDFAAPALSFRRRDGSTFDLRATRHPAVVHFWATWCAPCRDELPTFLALDVTGNADVVAVSLDARWETVERFMSLPMDRIALGRGADVARTFGDNTLPVTYVMDAHGRMRLRFVGARDWSHPEVLRSVRTVLERD